ncbi:isoprenyl transferase [bacterium]|nr:MAG: isoprenyl transferase [bacterium]
MARKPSSERAVPRHVAIIMDGNGRWASGRLLGRVRGHVAGIEAVRKVVRAAKNSGVRYLTLFTFSSENWKRPRAEVEALMGLMETQILKEAEALRKEGVRIRLIGALEDLPATVREAVQRAAEITKECETMDLILAISYGGRREILDAARKIAALGLTPEEITEESFSQNLYAPDVPDPDLIIRTSGERRLSNFLLWQAAYSEFYVTEVLWPDFDGGEFEKALEDYASRERRFGKTSEQLAGA